MEKDLEILYELVIKAMDYQDSLINPKRKESYKKYNKEYAKEYYIKNRERILEYNKKYSKDNKDRINKSVRERRKNKKNK